MSVVAEGGKVVRWSCQDCPEVGGGMGLSSAQAHADERDHTVIAQVTTVDVLVAKDHA